MKIDWEKLRDRVKDKSPYALNNSINKALNFAWRIAVEETIFEMKKEIESRKNNGK